MGAVSKTLASQALHYLHLAVWLFALPLLTAGGGGGLVAGLNLNPGHYMDHPRQQQHNSWPPLQQQQQQQPQHQASWQIEEAGGPPAARQPQQQEAAPRYWLSREQSEVAPEEQFGAADQFQEQLMGAQQPQHRFQPAYLGPISGKHQQVVDRASTAPTISRQVMAPPPFYELGLAPANVLQVETSSVNPNNHDNLKPAASETHINEVRAERALGARSLAYHPHREPVYSNQGPVKLAPINTYELDDATKEAGAGQKEQDMSSKLGQEEGTEAKSSQLDAGQPPETEKSDLGAGAGQVEPRQRRRIFNRILKKAEWNHLFVELSKVFLRYFLDLALKDIIGKQAGGTGASDSTTSRKKLDAQSELTDLLKDFVKTAISNI